jgi:hypothetical protein
VHSKSAMRKTQSRETLSEWPFTVGLSNVVSSCELTWRGPCASTGRDKVDRQLRNHVRCRLLRPLCNSRLHDGALPLRRVRHALHRDSPTA